MTPRTSGDSREHRGRRTTGTTAEPTRRAQARAAAAEIEVKRAITLAEIRALIAHERGPCLSVFMGTRAGRATEDRARWKALSKSARENIGQTLSAREIDALFAPIAQLPASVLGARGTPSFAAFSSGSWSATYCLPARFEDVALVGSSFLVRPLLHCLRSNQRYFLLDLSAGRVGLFTGDALGLAPVELPEGPGSFADAVGTEHRARAVSLRGKGRGHSSIWYGTGQDESAREEDQLKFLRAVDEAVWKVLRDEISPLVVVATEKLAHLYQRQSRNPYLLHDFVHGSFANASLEDLHTKAWPIVQADTRRREQELLDRYGNSNARDRVLDDASEIARCAVQGRVRELLVQSDARLWGRMEKTTGAIELHVERRGAQDDDVLDDIVEAVLQRGGEVYSFEAARMPSRSPVAATLRW